jgi:signal transduction histidine kinase/CheY-like chemotaxis protein
MQLKPPVSATAHPKQDLRYHYQTFHSTSPSGRQNMIRLVTYLIGAYLLLAGVFLYSYDLMMVESGSEQQSATSVMLALYGAMVLFFTVLILTFASARKRSEADHQKTRHQTAKLIDAIRAQRESDQGLQVAKEVAEASSLAKSKYVGAISHELRTPLNAIIGYSQLLHSEDALPERWRPALRVIRNSGEHISSLIDELLDISMIEAGRLQIFRDEVRVAEFLESIAETIRLPAREKGIGFVLDIPDNLPEAVYTDGKKLRQVLLNLLTNAVRATQNGQVTLRITYRGQVATFEIEDTGVGIAPDDIERIFQPFEQIHESGTAVKAGAGLGLTISRLMTEAMGGALEATSEPGKGTCFTVKLLLSFVPNPRVVAAPLEKISGYEGPRKTILVTDDDPNQLSLMQDIYLPLGFKVVTASNGADCIQCVEDHKPDMILLDVSMPDMTGWEVVKTLQQKRASMVPVVIISANPRSEAENNKLSHALGGYIMKPVNIPDLLATTEEILGIEWQYVSLEVPELESGFPTHLTAADVPIQTDLSELRRYGDIGHVRGVLNQLDAIEEKQPDCAQVIAYLRTTMHDIDFTEFDNCLTKLEEFNA